MRGFRGQISMSSTSTEDPLLSVTKLKIAFGSLVVIQDLTFEARAGDCLAVIGPNGSGKTVLLKALMNLIDYKGEIRWSHGARLGYVPQKIAADRHVVLYDRSNHAWAARVWWMLRVCGFDAAGVLNGGWQKWISEVGSPLQSLPAIRRGVFGSVLVRGSWWRSRRSWIRLTRKIRNS